MMTDSNAQPIHTEETLSQATENIAQESTQEMTESKQLEEAIARIQELESYIADANKREQDIQLRARAEIENIRRRSEQDVEKAHKFALERFSKDLLSVVDNLERGLSALENNTTDESIKGLSEGVQLTHKEFISVLVKHGIEAVGKVGEIFNPELHEAVSMQPSTEVESNHICTILQKGYMLQGRVIRPAVVIVAN